MRKSIAIIFAALFAKAAFAVDVTQMGQRPVRQSLVTWNAGTTTAKTRMLVLFDTNTAVLLHKVYLDTSATGQAGAWRRIDATADTCSNPVFIASDSAGSAWPVWQLMGWQTVRAKDKDSGAYAYRVQTRLRVWDNTIKNVRWTPWTYKGANQGDANKTVVDSLLFATPRVTTSISRYSLGMFLGVQARLCPAKVASTALQPADSLFLDSLYLIAR